MEENNVKIFVHLLTIYSRIYIAPNFVARIWLCGYTSDLLI